LGALETLSACGRVCRCHAEGPAAADHRGWGRGPGRARRTGTDRRASPELQRHPGQRLDDGVPRGSRSIAATRRTTR